MTDEEGSGWDAFGRVAAHPEPVAGTGSREFVLAGQRCWQLPENGWGAVLAWVAGPRLVLLVADRREDHTTILTCCSTVDGPSLRQHRPRSPEEQDIIDDDIDSYLLDADVPIRPRGYLWYVQLPDGLTSCRLLDAINAAERVLDKRTAGPEDVRHAMEITAAKLLRVFS